LALVSVPVPGRLLPSRLAGSQAPPASPQLSELMEPERPPLAQLSRESLVQVRPLSRERELPSLPWERPLSLQALALRALAPVLLSPQPELASPLPELPLPSQEPPSEPASAPLVQPRASLVQELFCWPQSPLMACSAPCCCPAAPRSVRQCFAAALPAKRTSYSG